MTLYHGSNIAALETLVPFQSNHEKPYVYLTDNEALAVLYAHNPLTRPNGFFTYRFDSTGKLHYDEYFEDALHAIYSGHGGYVYSCEAALSPMPNMPWVYVSGQPVAVAACRFIPDLYEEALRMERAGALIVHRYATLPERFLASIREMMLAEIEKHGLRGQPESEYALFIKRHFPGLL